jgi:putative peptide zinc metalloprotease protein
VNENRTVREADLLRPRLRADIHFSIRHERGEKICVIEDRHASRFHRVGLDEMRFLRALDGHRPLAGILAQLAREGDGHTFTESEGVRIVAWAKEQGLLAIEGTRSGSAREHAARTLRTAATWLNPLMLKIPLARPDRFFSRVAPSLRFACGPGGFAIWLIVLLVGAAHLAPEWSRFTRGFDGILSRDNWLWLLVVWLGLKIVHEFSHGLFCKHFGASVRELGVIFVLFVPMGYVDATASLGFASRWRRMMVAAAGMYAEFFVAALCAIWWARSPEGPTATVLHNAVVTGTVITLFFNANPLMRFDGYYLLSDLLELPNLSTRGRNWVVRAWLWLLTGHKHVRPAAPRNREDVIIAIYGISAFAWQTLVAAGLILAASTLLRGGGMLIAAFAVLVWIGVPLLRFGEMLGEQIGRDPRRIANASLRAIALSVAIGFILFIPFHKPVASEGVVELADTRVLRAECPGFVASVHVTDGDTVSEGQLLIVLHNEQAASDLAAARIDLAQQELKGRVAYAREDVASWQAEQARVASLRKAVSEHERLVASLRIVAPFAGRVHSRQLAHIEGAFAKTGDELLRIGRAEGNDVKLAISQDAEPHFREALGRHVHVRVNGRAATGGATLTNLEARASREVRHPELTALAGGALALRAGSDPKAARYELAEPYFEATARLGSGLDLFPGEIARIRFTSPRSVCLWQLGESAFHRWVKRRAHS